MRILVVTGKMESGGAETHVQALVQGLVQRGHEVSLASAGGRLAEALCEQGVPHLYLPLHTKNPVAMLLSKRRLSRFVRRIRPNVIHAHTRIAARVACTVGQRQGVCVVTTAHARFSMSLGRGALSRWGEWVIAVSQDIRQHLLSSRTPLPLERISTVPNGIDTRRFCPSERQNSQKVANIAFVSRLDGDCSEAAFSLCRIAQRLERELGCVNITVCGGGTQLSRIRKMARRVNAETGRKTVRVIGEVEHVEDILRHSHVFVGVSRAALEAMSCAVPVVLAGNEGFLGVLGERELPLAESTNFCCRGERALEDGALLDAICTLSRKSARQRESLGKLLREYVLKKHSVRLCVERTEKVYRAALAGASGNGDRGQILLCGYYGYGNMGDDALALRAIERAREKYPRHALCMLTANGARDARKFCVRCACRSSPLSVIREIKRSEIIVFGGGTLLQNDTSRRSLWYYLWLLRLARKYGKRTQLWANGIGEIHGKRARRATAQAIGECELVGLRDRASLTQARELLCEHSRFAARVVLEDDLAHSAFAEDGERVRYLLDTLGIANESRFAVIALRGTERAGYLGIMRRFVSALAREGTVPVFVVMFAAEDLSASRRMCREVGGVLAYPMGIADTASLMRRACVVLGMRYHALVFASASGVPFIGFGAQQKIESFCRSGGGIYFLDMLSQEGGAPSLP